MLLQPAVFPLAVGRFPAMIRVGCFRVFSLACAQIRSAPLLSFAFASSDIHCTSRLRESTTAQPFVSTDVHCCTPLGVFAVFTFLMFRRGGPEYHCFPAPIHSFLALSSAIFSTSLAPAVCKSHHFLPLFWCLGCSFQNRTSISRCCNRLVVMQVCRNKPTSRHI